MTRSATTTTVRRQILVHAPISEAFKVFTGRFGDFKPREHNLLRAPITETVFEPRVGGNIYDRAVDGTECRWARILAFDHRWPDWRRRGYSGGSHRNRGLYALDAPRTWGAKYTRLWSRIRHDGYQIRLCQPRVSGRRRT